MSSARRIEYEIHCSDCGYDLRSLSHAGRCPECGHPVLLTLCDMAIRAKELKFGLTGDPQYTQLGVAAANSPYVLDAVVFLCFAIRFVNAGRDQPSNPPGIAFRNDVSARDLCLGIRDFATIEFGQAAATQLREWKLATRADVRNLVDQMIRFKVLQPSPEGLSDFETPECPDPIQEIA